MDIYFNILPEELNKLILFNINTFDELINLKDIFMPILESDTFWKEKVVYYLPYLDKLFFGEHFYKNVDLIILNYCLVYKAYHNSYTQAINYTKKMGVIFDYTSYLKGKIMMLLDHSTQIHNNLLKDLSNNNINTIGLYAIDEDIVLYSEKSKTAYKLKTTKLYIFVLILNMLIYNSL